MRSYPLLTANFGQRGNLVAPRSRTSVDRHERYNGSAVSVGSSPASLAKFASVAQWFGGKVRQNMFKVFTACRKVGMESKRYAYFSPGTVNPSEQRTNNPCVGGSNPS